MARGHVERQTDTARHALEEPDVADGNGQFDMSHAFAANARECHFHAATIADNTAMFDALVFSAGTFPVLHRPENALAEQAAFFGLERAVIDSLRILDFAIAPGTDSI